MRYIVRINAVVTEDRYTTYEIAAEDEVEACVEAENRFLEENNGDIDFVNTYARIINSE